MKRLAVKNVNVIDFLPGETLQSLRHLGSFYHESLTAASGVLSLKSGLDPDAACKKTRVVPSPTPFSARCAGRTEKKSTLHM